MEKLKSIFCIFLFTGVFFNAYTQSITTKPNVILIVADDLGYGDLSSYGQTKYKTPNIDQLAKEGMLFTQHYAGAPVCAPSRSALLTAKHTGHTTIRGNKKANKYGDFPLSANDTILPMLFQSEGYVTGMFGKWGLGTPKSSGDANAKGFQDFFGYYGHLAAHNYYPTMLWHNNQQVAIPQNKHYSNTIYAPYVIQDSILSFIEDNKTHPFFLYIPTIIPHAELCPPNAEMQNFIGKYGQEKPYRGIKTMKFTTLFGAYDKQENPKAAFAAMISLLDKQVGQIVEKLKETGVYENTIIIFTSDNGPHLEGGAQPDFFNSNGGLSGYKRDLYEGGIRVPLIIHWSKNIQPGTSDFISANWDLMPTLASLIKAKMPSNTDGISLLPTLLNTTTPQAQHPYLYWEFHEKGGKQAIRMGKWKAIVLNSKHPKQAKFLLFNIDEDISEEKDLSKTFPDIVEQLKLLMKQARTPSKNFPFNDR